MPYPERVQTPQATLRRITPEDAAAFTAIWSDPEVWSSLRPGEEGDPRAAAAESHERQVEHWDRHGFGLWAVVPKGESEPVGWAGAWLPDFVPELRGEVEVGWTLRRAWWGRGLATETARQAAAVAFEHISPPRLISLIAPDNHRSAAVARRLGMRQATTATTDRDFVLRVFELTAPPA